MMAATTVNYLEEYRKRYGGLKIQQDSQSLHTKSNSSIDHLLSRYLTPIVTSSQSISDTKPAENEPITQCSDITKANNAIHYRIRDPIEHEEQRVKGNMTEKESTDESDDSSSIELGATLLPTSNPSQSHSIVTVDSSLACDEDIVKPQNKSESEDNSDDCFSDELGRTLLPTSSLTKRPSLTVSSILEKDEHLCQITRHKTYRRSKSNPTEEREKRKSTGKGQFSNSFCSSRQLVSELANDEELNTIVLADIEKRQLNVSRNISQSRVVPLSRRDSSLSNISVESGHSRGSTVSRRSGILEISDEDLEYEFGEQANNSQHGDTDSCITRLLFDTESMESSEIAGDTYEDLEHCVKCHPTLSPRRSVSSNNGGDLSILCRKCLSLQTERCETIKEILESEVKYHRDLILIQEEFIQALAKTSLMSADEICTIFGNLSQLIAVSQKFCGEIQTHLDELVANQDIHFSGAMIGQLICESSAMFLSFETYCLNFNLAISTIEILKKERELVNLFLEVSQKENPLLRRMDLKTFLMVPVQRVMKYPLLLKRLQKATDDNHCDRNNIESAIQKLTNILLHINAQSKLLTNILSPSKETSANKKRTSFEIALTKLCLDSLKWRPDEIHFLVSGKIGYLLPAENRFAEKLNNLRFNTAYAVLVSKGRDRVPPVRGTELYFPGTSKVSDVALIIVKKGSSKLQTLREPFHLSNCIISRNTEFYDVFQVQERVKETFVLRPVHNSDPWYKYLKYFSLVLGGRNQCRRDALSNALLHT